MERILILAYGNPLRGDDAVGWIAGQELKSRIQRDEVEILCLHQLTPEIAERVSWADAVIFVDCSAQGTPGAVQSRRINTEASELQFSHQLNPAAILTLAKELYGANPLAYVVTLSGEAFDHREDFSPAVKDSMPKLLAEVERLVKELLAGHMAARAATK